MKVIFLNRFFYPDHSATSRLVSDLAFYLAHRGCEVAVVTSRLRYEDAVPAYAVRETVSGVEIFRVWTSRFGRFALAAWAGDRLSYLLCLRGLALLAPGQTGRCGGREDRWAFEYSRPAALLRWEAVLDVAPKPESGSPPAAKALYDGAANGA